jgi:hypothetical protein
MAIEKAIKKKQKLKILIESASGGGKTMSSLRLAKGLVGDDGKIVVLDTENGSASLYADRFDFYTDELKPPYSPNNYILKINEIEKFGADVCIIDSMSMVWSGQGGCLEMQNNLGGKFQDWAKVSPQYEKFINKILQSPMHIICTARTKSDWSMEKDDKGKTVVTKLGLKTEARDGTDYTFTTVFRLNQSHIASVSKDRTGLFEGRDEMITEETGKEFLNWLNNGADVKEQKQGQEEQDLTEIAQKIVKCNSYDELKEYFDTIEPMTEEIKYLFTSRREAIESETGKK